jgi:pyridoxamine 5'-phosphate oxidase
MEDPFLKFKRWQDKIRRSRGHDRAEAACLSTVDPDGWPEGRMVLVRSSGPEGFTFYTNHGSHKAKSLAATPRASLTYYWEDLGRQVRVQGSVQRVSEEESMAYFATRSRLSQIGAWAPTRAANCSKAEQS